MFDNFLNKKNYAITQAKKRIFNAESHITGMGLDSSIEVPTADPPSDCILMR